MDKKVGLAFFISLLIIVGYNYIFSRLAQEQKTTSVPSPSAFTVSPQAEPLNSGIDSVNTLPEDSRDIVVDTELWRLVLTSSGARIKSCQMKNYAEERLDLKKAQSRMDEIDRRTALLQGSAQTQAKAQEKNTLEREKKKLTALLGRIGSQQVRVMTATGAETEAERAELVSLAATVDLDFSPQIFLQGKKAINTVINTANYQCLQNSLSLNARYPHGKIEFTFTHPQGWAIKKIYSFNNSNYGIELDIIFYDWQPFMERQNAYFILYYGPDVGMPQAQKGRRTFGYRGPISCFQSGENCWVQREKYGRSEQGVFIQRKHEHKGNVLWAGLENKYFLTAMMPMQTVETVVVEKNRFGEQRIGLKMPWQNNSINQHSFKLYLGPKRSDRLKGVDATLAKSIDYGFFGPIGQLMYRVLVFFSRWTHNFGWAIVLLCVATKVVFYPLTHHSFESMQKMQTQMRSLQPEIDALREKFRDSPQKLQKETFGFYRKKGVNPLSSCQSGCLPLLLQMPVFFALYTVLYNSIELRGTPFIFWIQDLSAKDPYYILPILMGISMFIQQKFTGMGTAGAGAAQQEQAKLMGIMMPVVLTWVFASLPSGVVLYWFTFNIVTALQQLLIKRKQRLNACPT